MTYPQQMTVTVTLAGTDITAYVVPGSLKISNVLTRRVDTCDFELVDAAVVNPQAWQELIVTDGATRIFGGYVVTAEETPGPNLGLNYSVSASDYSLRFERVSVKEEFTDTTDAGILAALFAEYLPGEGYDAATFVEALVTHPRLRFNRKSLLEIVDKLVSMAKADWYVDYQKRLHFFRSSTAPTPFSLSDAPDLVASMPYSDLQVSRDGSGIVNRVEVLGGNYLSEDTTFILAGTGQDKRVNLPFKLHAPVGQTSIQVWRNDGTVITPVWTPMTVKAAYVSSLGGPDEVLYYYEEKVLEQQAVWPNLNNAVKVTARYEVPLRTRVTNQASVDHYGFTFDGVLDDSTIVEKSVARLAGLAVLAESAFSKTAVSCTTRQPGLVSGQVVRFTNAIHGLNADYLVHKVITRVDVNGLASFQLELGTYSADLVDLFLQLARASKPEKPWSDNEVLDELLQRAETLSLLESVMAPVSSTAPYYFSTNTPKPEFKLQKAFTTPTAATVHVFTVDVYPGQSTIVTVNSYGPNGVSAPLVSLVASSGTVTLVQNLAFFNTHIISGTSGTVTLTLTIGASRQVNVIVTDLINATSGAYATNGVTGATTTATVNCTHANARIYCLAVTRSASAVIDPMGMNVITNFDSVGGNDVCVGWIDAVIGSNSVTVGHSVPTAAITLGLAEIYPTVPFTGFFVGFGKFAP